MITKLVLDNPYRTLGLLVGATAAEQRKQITRLQRFIEAEQSPGEDNSFPLLGELRRTIDSVNEASSKLNLDLDKISSALFWFYLGNEIFDEPVFDALKIGDLEVVRNIWEKKTSNEEMTLKNASAFFNLGTFYLSGIADGTNTDEYLIRKAIEFKVLFIENGYHRKLMMLCTDENFKISKESLQEIFLNSLFSEIESSKIINTTQFLDIIRNIEFSAKESFLKSFVQKPIETIEAKLEEAKVQRKNDKTKSISIAQNLLKEIDGTLKQLKSILGTSDIKYTTLSDRFSDFLLQCGIDYFKHYKESDSMNEVAAKKALELFAKAKTYAVGNIVKERIKENTENLNEWIDEKPEREKQQRILVHFEKLTALIDEYDSKSETIANAKLLLSAANPILQNIKTVLGSTDDLYLGLSTRIASDAQGMCVSEVNSIQDKFSKTFDNSTKLALIMLLKNKVDEAYQVTNTISTLDLRADFRSSFNSNRSSLQSLKTQLGNVGGGSRTSGGGNSGCYIATMAYGDYDHPQVRELRRFRDDVLLKSKLGTYFVDFYYWISPKLVEVLNNKKNINSSIRVILNLIIKIIKK
ncbi:MAG: hypothetical protein K9I37_08090 [Crocinitomicaceae bacterium]|nr:hypothetical protein [Crocinitomicaceae bacterium]